MSRQKKHTSNIYTTQMLLTSTLAHTTLLPLSQFFFLSIIFSFPYVVFIYTYYIYTIREKVLCRFYVRVCMSVCRAYRSVLMLSHYSVLIAFEKFFVFFFIYVYKNSIYIGRKKKFQKQIRNERAISECMIVCVCFDLLCVCFD